MTKLLRVGLDGAVMIEPTTMTVQQLSETADLESWIVANPALLDPTLKVVTTQFNRWQSDARNASERLDVLGIAESGELVVIELKRDRDKNIHLQAITYGALVAGFTGDSLAAVHAEWLSQRRGVPVSPDDALVELQAHVDVWSDELLQLPRLILVAEQFPPQVLTTVQWLDRMAPDLRIECHSYTVFGDGGGVTVTFDRLFPVNDLADQMLMPAAPSATPALAKLESSRRRAKSVAVIHELGAIPEGSAITLQLQSLVRPEVVERVNAWLDEAPLRRAVTWADDRSRPLKWAAWSDPDASWSLSSLRNHIFTEAGVATPTFSAADGWCYQDVSIYHVANAAVANET